MPAWTACMLALISQETIGLSCEWVSRKSPAPMATAAGQTPSTMMPTGVGPGPKQLRRLLPIRFQRDSAHGNSACNSPGIGSQESGAQAKQDAMLRTPHR
jgi:hypothetical protein